MTAPVSAQEEEFPNPIDVLLDAFESPEGQEFTARFLREPVPGRGTLEDPIGDFEHSTGQEPGFTPGHLDITSTWALELDPGPVDLFTPTDANLVWAPTGRLDLTPHNYDPFATFTGEQVHDGTQYESGAVLFGFTLIDTPPEDPPGRCEYVIWVNDSEREATFVNNPSFPADPAGGTNLAVGLALNPSDGPGNPSTFALELQESGGFAPIFEADIRAFVTPRYVGVLAPRALLGDPAGLNFYTFCAEEGFIFEPDVSGSDQTGLTDFTESDLGVVQIEAREVAPESTTTTTETTATEPPPDTTTTVPLAEEEIDEDASEFPWWFVLMAGGIVLALAGWWLFNREGDPCRELLEAWRKAQEACEQARDAAAEAADACESTALELERLEDEREEMCKVWPPACWDTEEGDWIEDDKGNRITSRDIHMRKVALGDVWADYRAGKLSAGEVEARWREMDTPEFREDVRQTDDLFKELLADIETDLTDAEQDFDESCQAAAEAQKDADEACAKAAEAKEAYERCVEQASAHAMSEDRAGGPLATAGPSVAASSGDEGEPTDPCDGDAGKRETRPGGRADEIRVFVDFSVITGVAEGSGRKVAAGERLAIDLNDLATELDFAGDLLNARAAGTHIGGALNGYAAGKYTVTASGVIKGGIDATMATTELVPEVPTTPLQAGVEGLEALARLGGVIAGKVTDWMTDVQLMTVRLTMFYQDIVATPYEIWECRAGEGWVCTERVWEFEVSRLKRVLGKDRKYTVNSDVRRREFRRVIRGMSQRAASTIKQDAESLIRWRAEHEPGACR